MGRFDAKIRPIARFRGIGGRRAFSLSNGYERIARVMPETLGSRRAAKLLSALVLPLRIDWGKS
ncbi:MAG: hypothetical protein AAFV85_27585 [Cyanobacteria bacterium J06634_6]